MKFHHKVNNLNSVSWSTATELWLTWAGFVFNTKNYSALYHWRAFDWSNLFFPDVSTSEDLDQNAGWGTGKNPSSASLWWTKTNPRTMPGIVTHPTCFTRNMSSCLCTIGHHGFTGRTWLLLWTFQSVSVAPIFGGDGWCNWFLKQEVCFYFFEV